ncbi:KAT8 regulatory NSL complex subunit 3-like [Mya arenaria]|uniref:KAT8 regulatory NSL complex subunit 3-like n=1 Tax=Mya arenaria TaxID=6604 RepID=UPI0022E3CEA1|nr:KAT8 regulatory NSL complex subunit 3-like [Mya arenaria]
MAGTVMSLDIVSIDHCYSKPWSAHPDASNARPLRTLYMDKFPRNRSLEQSLPEPDIQIDVESVTPVMPVMYDTSKARSLMCEVERQVLSLHDDRGDEWEDKVNRVGWTPQQNRLFNKVNKLLVGDRLSKLANVGTKNEPIQRRNQVDKTAKRVRHALATYKWNPKLMQWLHGVLLDNLGTQALAIYLEVLQTLRTKIPSLIDRMTSVGGTSLRSQQLSGEVLANIIKKSWDPIHSTYSQMKLKKLPGNPLILVAPSGPTGPNSPQTKRMRYWNNQLMGLGKVIPVMMHMINTGSGVSIAQCLEHMIVAVRTKVEELKSHFVNRPIVLLGWNIGALVACHVALQESVSAIVCLGFPYTGVGGGRGDADDQLLDCRTPTLFVIGQHANTCSIDDIEDMREKMRAENSLVVVGGSDDNLRMSRAKKKSEGLTQIMVDKGILDEISDFLGGVLTQGAIMQESVIVDLSDISGARKTVQVQDIDSFATQTTLDGSEEGTPGRLSIAKALRARALGSSSSFDSPQSVSSVASMGSPVRIKRKYTKRKDVTKPLGIPSPRKRFRSTPTPPPMLSPVSMVQSPQSAGTLQTMACAPELSGLLQSRLPTFRIVTDERGQSRAVFATPATPTSQASTTEAPLVNLPSPAILGSLEEPPLVAYKLDDYQKKFQDPEPTAPRTTAISMEAIIRAQQASQSQAQPSTSTPISSLLSLARQIPGVSSPSSVASTIQQLLSSLARSPLPTSVISPIISSAQGLISSSHAAQSEVSGIQQISQSAGLSQIQISQSGSPLQNSVPTLMSSLAKSSAIPANSLLKRMTSVTIEQPTDLAAKAAAPKPEVHEIATQSRLMYVTPLNNQETTTIDLTEDTDDNETEVAQNSGPSANSQSSIQITVSRQGAAPSIEQSSSLPQAMSLSKHNFSNHPSTISSTKILIENPSPVKVSQPQLIASKIIAEDEASNELPQLIATKIIEKEEEPINTEPPQLSAMNLRTDNKASHGILPSSREVITVNKPIQSASAQLPKTTVTLVSTPVLSSPSVPSQSLKSSATKLDEEPHVQATLELETDKGTLKDAALPVDLTAPHSNTSRVKAAESESLSSEKNVTVTVIGGASKSSACKELSDPEMTTSQPSGSMNTMTVTVVEGTLKGSTKKEVSALASNSESSGITKQSGSKVVSKSGTTSESCAKTVTVNVTEGGSSKPSSGQAVAGVASTSETSGTPKQFTPKVAPGSAQLGDSSAKSKQASLASTRTRRIRTPKHLDL